MAPLLAPGRDRAGREDEDGCEARGDRKVLAVAARGRAGGRGAVQRRGSVARFPQARKPLVEKKRRARINESLQELRLLLAGAEVRRAGARGLRAGGGRGRAGPHRPSPTGRSRPRRCRPSWRTQRCWSSPCGACRARCGAGRAVSGGRARGRRRGARSPGLPLPRTQPGLPGLRRGARSPPLLGESPSGWAGPRQWQLTGPGAALSPSILERRA